MANHVSKSRCPKCDVIQWSKICINCNEKTVIYRSCPTCGRIIWGTNLIVKPDGRSTQCRNCQYKVAKKYYERKKEQKHGTEVL